MPKVLGLAVFREWGDEHDGGVVFYIGAGLLEVSGAVIERRPGRCGCFFRSETPTTSGSASSRWCFD